jgi:hypothetical protein
MSKTHQHGSHKSPSPLLRALSARRALSAQDLVALALPPYTMLDALHRGHGSAKLLSSLCDFAMFSELLAVRGHLPDCRPIVYRAQAALHEVARHGSTGMSALSVSTHAALTNWLSKFVEQLENAGMQDILAAHAALPAFAAQKAVPAKQAA